MCDYGRVAFTVGKGLPGRILARKQGTLVDRHGYFRNKAQLRDPDIPLEITTDVQLLESAYDRYSGTQADPSIDDDKTVTQSSLISKSLSSNDVQKRVLNYVNINLVIMKKMIKYNLQALGNQLSFISNLTSTVLSLAERCRSFSSTSL